MKSLNPNCKANICLVEEVLDLVAIWRELLAYSECLRATCPRGRCWVWHYSQRDKSRISRRPLLLERNSAHFSLRLHYLQTTKSLVSHQWKSVGINQREDIHISCHMFDMIATLPPSDSRLGSRSRTRAFYLVCSQSW